MSRSGTRARLKAPARRPKTQYWESVLSSQPTSPGKSAAEGARWIDPFKNGLALYTIMLNVGIGLHALDVFIIATVMPRVVKELGGAEYYTWATMLYMVASIIGLFPFVRPSPPPWG